ncbi:MAG: type III pantothenate kinase [Thermomicrobiales bacterium]
MLILIDAGNSNTVVAACEPGDSSFTHVWRFASRRKNTGDDWRASLVPLLRQAGIRPSQVTGAVISSVVPKITRELILQCEGWLRVTPIVVSANLTLSVNIAIEKPEDIGADRICNAVAAFELIRGPVIVVDLGTATKIEAIHRSGAFLGGAIAPGIGTSLDALVARAAQLYPVELSVPETAIGTNTVHAVQSGLFLGHLTMIEGMVSRFKDTLGSDASVVLTGGYGPIFWQRSEVFSQFEPELTLRGALRIWELNS